MIKFNDIELENKLAIHIATFHRFRETGYENTIELIKKTLNRDGLPDESREYLLFRIRHYEAFYPERNELLKVLHEDGMKMNDLRSWVMQRKKEGKTKKEIYETLQEFFVFIQFYPETRENEFLYDKLGEFLDTFSDHGYGGKTLPDESI